MLIRIDERTRETLRKVQRIETRTESFEQRITRNESNISSTKWLLGFIITALIAIAVPVAASLLGK